MAIGNDERAETVRDREDILYADLPVIDAHHHLWDLPTLDPYLCQDFVADVASGHRVVASVHVQCNMGYRTDGPAEMRPVGETEFIVQQAEVAAQNGVPGLCSGIVGHAALDLGDRVAPVLEGHLAAGGDRFKGIRHHAFWDEDASRLYPERTVNPELYLTPAFRAGFAHLARLGLSFDAGLFHPRLLQIVDLAREFPETSILVNHVGYPIGMGRFEGRHAEVRSELRASFEELAECPNVAIKFGGFGSRPHNMDFGVGLEDRTSETLAQVFQPYFDLCIDTFGPERLVFESNYPVDAHVAPYAVLWNAFKRISAGCSPSERLDMFAGNARRLYRLEVPTT